MAAHSSLGKKSSPLCFIPLFHSHPPLQHGKRVECLVYRCEKVVLGKRNFSLSLSPLSTFLPIFIPFFRRPLPPWSFPFSAFFNLVSLNFLAVPHLFIVGLIWRDILTLFDNFSLPLFFFVALFLSKRIPLQIPLLLKRLFCFHYAPQDVLK